MADDNKIDWMSEPCSWREIAIDCQLPQVVKLQRNGRPLNLGHAVDPDKPFVVYSRRVRTKIYAESLIWKKSKGRHVASGSLLEIPKDYAGWFAKVSPDGQTLKPLPSIEAVSESGCKQFLTQTTAVGFDSSLGEDGQLALLSERTVYAGEILDVGDAITRKWKLRNESTRDESALAETRFLKCTDHKGQEICLPLAHPGNFYAIADEDDVDATNRVYQITTMIQWEMPQMVSLVFGWTPILAKKCRFEGILRLVGLQKPDTLVVCSLAVGSRNVFTEIPTDINIDVVRANGMQQFESNSLYQQTVAVCTKKTYAFVTCMKSLDEEYERIPRTDQADQDNDDAKAKEECRYGVRTVSVDMDAFNPLNIFPPLDIDQETLSDGWTLSFGDEENNLESVGAQMRDVRLSRNSSLPGDRSNRKRIPKARVDLRAKRASQVRQREAKC